MTKNDSNRMGWESAGGRQTGHVWLHKEQTDNEDQEIRECDLWFVEEGLMLSKYDLSTERVTKVELIPDIAVKNNVLFQLNCDIGIKEFAVQLGTSMG